VFGISSVVDEMEMPDIHVFVRDITGLLSEERVIRRKIKPCLSRILSLVNMAMKEYLK
jgi:hypothetical protein